MRKSEVGGRNKVLLHEDASLPRSTFPLPNSALHNFAVVTAGAAFVLLFAGGLVTSTGSGLAVPDWPLSFGTLFPKMVGGVRFEHSHRLIAGTVATLTFILAGWILSKEERPLVRALAWAAAGGILVQALLGGLTVLLKLPPAVSMSHAIVGQTVFCLLLGIADMTKTSPLPLGEGRVRATLLRTGFLAIGALYIQLFLGALVRHTGAGTAIHALWALAVTAHVGMIVARTFRNASEEPAFTRPAMLLAALLPLQLVMGLATWALRGSLPWHAGFDQGALTATAHLAVGAAILGTCWIWTLRAWRMR